MTYKEFLKIAAASMSTRESFDFLGKTAKARAKQINADYTLGWATIQMDNEVIMVGIDENGGYVKKGTLNVVLNRTGRDPDSEIDIYDPS